MDGGWPGKPGDWASHRIEAQERIMALQFGQVEKRLERIEAMIGGLEKRLWMSLYGVAGVIFAQAVQSLIDFVPKGG